MYTNQSLHVKWRNHFSEKCNARNGLKQGEVLSRILFSVYIDGLFTLLIDNSFGCHIGQYFVEGVWFAD